MKTVTVNAKALREVLQALTGPGYLIRELQAIRGGPAVGLLDNNPIDELIRQYNEQLEEAPND